jgi:sugar (pentulose or hexulose) kinase
MAIVAGVDCETLSVRVSVVDSERALLASAVHEYPLHPKREDPEYATPSPQDHWRALAAATPEAPGKADVSGDPARRARKRFQGVAACIHRSGAFRSSCTGCIRIHTVTVYSFSTARRSIASGGGI